MIAAHIISNFALERPETYFSYFFCKDGDQRLMYAHSIVQTLSYQLAIQNKGFRQELDRTRLEENFVVIPAVGIRLLFNRLLHQPLLRLTDVYDEESVYCVIDGLDEADFRRRDGRSGRSDIEILLQLLSRCPRIRLLVLSRCTAEICSIMSSIPSVTREIVTADTEGDIQNYVSCKVKWSEGLQLRFGQIKVDPVDHICRSAAGNFLWAEIVLCYLEGSTSVKELVTNLHEIPMHFYELYEQILRRIVKSISLSKKAIITEIIRIIICSPRELQLGELQAIVEITLQDQFFDFQHLVRSECGTFLRLVSDPITPTRKSIRIVHDTFREFITSQATVHEDFHVSVQDSHGQIANTLLKYLSRTDFGPRLSPGKFNRWREDTLVDTMARFPLLTYASTQWAFHLRRSGIENESTKKLWTAVRTFLVEGPLLVWIEALAIFQEFSTLSQMVEDVLSWLQFMANIDPPLAYDVGLIEKWSRDVSRLIRECSIVREYPNTIHDLPFDLFIQPSLLNERFGKNKATVAGGLSIPVNPAMLGATDVYKSDYDLAAVSDDGRRYALTSLKDIRIFDQTTGGTVSILSAPGLSQSHDNGWAVLAMAFSRENNMFAAVYISLVVGAAQVAYHPTLLIYDLETRHLISSVELPTDACGSTVFLVDRIEFAPDGNSVRAGCWSHIITNDVTTFDTCPQFSPTAQAVLLSPDRRWVLSIENFASRVLSGPSSSIDVRFSKPPYYQFTKKDPSKFSPTELALAYSRHRIAPFEWWQLWREVTRAYQFTPDSVWFARLTDQGSIVVRNLLYGTEKIISLPSGEYTITFINVVFDRKSELMAWTFDQIGRKIRDTRIEIWSLRTMSSIGGFYLGARHKERLILLSENQILTYRECVVVWDVHLGLQSDMIGTPFQAENWFIGNYYGGMNVTYFSDDRIVLIFRQNSPSVSKSCPFIVQIYRPDLEYRWTSSSESPLFQMCEASNMFPYACYGNVIAIGDIILRISEQSDFEVSKTPKIWPFEPDSVLATAFHIRASFMACLESRRDSTVILHLWDLHGRTAEKTAIFKPDDAMLPSASNITALILFDPAQDPCSLVIILYQVRDSPEDMDVGKAKGILQIRIFDTQSLTLKKTIRAPNYRPGREDPTSTYMRGYISQNLDSLIVCEERKHLNYSQLWAIDLENDTATSEFFPECCQLNYLPTNQMAVAIDARGWILSKLMRVADIVESKDVNDEVVLIRDDWKERGWKKLAYLPPSFLPCYETGIAIHPKGELAYVGEFGKRLVRISFEW